MLQRVVDRLDEDPRGLTLTGLAVAQNSPFYVARLPCRGGLGGSVRLAEAELITKGDTGCPGSGRQPG
jgi:hypothetical protein